MSKTNATNKNRPPVDNTNCPDEYPTYDDTVRNLAAKSGKWFYRSCLEVPGPFFLCNADDERLTHMGGTLNPFSVYYEDNPGKNVDEVTPIKANVNKKPPLKTTSLSTPVPLPQKPQFTTNPTPLPAYHKVTSPSHPRPVINLVDPPAAPQYQYIPNQPDYAFHVLNTNISDLSHQLAKIDEKRSTYNAIIESSIQKTYELKEQMRVLGAQVQDLNQTLPILIEALAANTVALKKSAQPPAKKRKITIENSDTEEEGDKEDKLMQHRLASKLLTSSKNK